MEYKLKKVSLEPLFITNKEDIPTFQSKIVFTEKNIGNTEFPFNSLYIVKHDENRLGYVYVSSLMDNSVTLKYVVDERIKDLSDIALVLEQITSYLSEYDMIKTFCLHVDPKDSYEFSLAVDAGYYPDCDDFESNGYRGPILFKKNNKNYKRNRR